MRKKIIPNRAKKASEIAALDGAEARVAEQRDVEHRRAARAAPRRRTRPSTSAATANAASTSAVGPAARRRLDQAPDQRGQRGEGEHEAAQVEPRRGRVAALGHEAAAGEQRDDDDRQVDEEDPAPARRARSASRRRPGRSRCRGRRRRPRCRSPSPRSCAGNVGGEDRERRGHDERAADAHQRRAWRSAARASRRARSRASRGRRRAGRSVSARLRPKRSPSEPAVSSTPAKTSM